MIARIRLIMLISLWAATANGQPLSTITVGLEDFQTAQHIRCQAVNGSFESRRWNVSQSQERAALRVRNHVAKRQRTAFVGTQIKVPNHLARHSIQLASA